MANIYQAGGKAVGKALSKLKSKGAPKAAKEAAEGTTDEWTKAQAGRAALDLEEQQARIQAAKSGFDKEKESLLSGDKAELQRRVDLFEEQIAEIDGVIGMINGNRPPTPQFTSLTTKKNLYEAALSGDKKKVDEAYAAFKPAQIEKNKDEDLLEAWRQYSATSPEQTTALATTPGAKLSRAEPVTESEYIPPAGPEERKLLPPGPGTALVPTGYGRTTFIAGERGISAGEPEKVLGPTREMATFSEPGPFQERIREGLTAPRPQADATIADRISASQKLTKTQKVGAGLATAGAAGMVKGALTPEDEDKSVSGARLSPKITGETYKDIKFEPSAAEVQAAVDKGGMETTRALWDRYDKLNAEFQKNITEGGMEYADPKKAAAVFLQSKQPFTGPPRAAGKPAVEEKVSSETEKMTQPANNTGSKKEQQAGLTTPPGGIVSEPRPVQGKPTAAKPQSQREIALSTELDINQFQNKLASGQPISRGDLLAITNKMQELKVDPVTADPSLVQKIEAAKEEARKAYQQEADRNQWAEVAQTLGNAVATFIAARQGVADRPLTLPQIDYGARTAQALRAYQTELSAAGEQARILERETDRKEREAEKAVALQQRQYSNLLSLGEKAIDAQERKAERAQDLATRLTISQLGIDKANQIQAARDEKAKIQAKQQGEEKLSKFLSADINRTNQEIARLNKQLESANQVATSKDNKAFEKALPDYMTTSGIDISSPEFQKKGWFGGVSQDQDKIKASAQAAAARIMQQVKELQAKKATSENDLQSLRPGEATQPTAPRQAPAGDGMVDMVSPAGKKLKVPAAKAAELEAAGAIRVK